MLAEDICNRALDAAGSALVIGDLQEESREAQVCLRAYAPCLEQLLRAAMWDFARQQSTLQLLADATGNTPNVGTLVPLPWVYEYAAPIDMMKARFVPRNNYTQEGQVPQGNISIPATPLTTATTVQPNPGRIIPARFLIANDINYPAVPAAPSWGQQTQWWEVQGISPASRTVILTNVKNAVLVYTALIPYPSIWDSLFTEAMVALLASRIALPLAKDKKLGASLRAQNIEIAKGAIQQARITNGNEGWGTNTDIIPDYIRFRNSGGGFGAGRGDVGFGGDGPGVLGYGWDSLSFEGNSSAY
jgi:hypothetical protein